MALTRKEINKRFRLNHLESERKRVREKNALWRAEHPEDYLRYRLTRYYGLGAYEHYTEQLAEQSDVCAVCGKKSDDMLHLDHNHATKQLRGALCGKCNRALGLFEENPALLQAAAEYLKRWAI